MNFNDALQAAEFNSDFFDPIIAFPFINTPPSHRTFNFRRSVLLIFDGPYLKVRHIQDPHDSYIKVPDDFDYSRIFRSEYPRVIFNTMFSMNNMLYSPFDKNGELLVLNDRKHITVCIDIVSEEMYIEYYGKHYTCLPVGERKREKVQEVEGQKQLQELLDERRKETF